MATQTEIREAEKLRTQYKKLIDLFEYAGKTGYLKGPMPMHRKGLGVPALEQTISTLVPIAQDSITLPFLTIEQAAAWLGMNPRTLRHHIFVSKQMRTFKPGGKMVQLRLQDVKEFKRGREA